MRIPIIAAAVLLRALPVSAAGPDPSWYWEVGSVPAIPAFVAFTAPRIGHHGVGNFLSGVSHGGWSARDDRVLIAKTGIGLMAQNDPSLAQGYSLRLFDSVQPVLFTGAAVRVLPGMAVSLNAGRSFWFRAPGFWHVWASVSVGGP